MEVDRRKAKILHYLEKRGDREGDDRTSEDCRDLEGDDELHL